MARPTSSPNLVPGGLYRLAHHLESLPASGEIRGETALVTDVGGEALAGEDLRQRVVDLGPGTEGLAIRRCATRHHHELLDVDRVGGMRTAVDHVEAWDGEDTRRRPTEVPIQGKPDGGCGGPGHRQRDPQDGVGAECLLVRRPVEVEHSLVDILLAGGVHPEQRRGDRVADMTQRLLHALSAEPGLVVAQLDRFAGPGGGAGGHGRPTETTPGEEHLDLDCRVAPRVEDLAGADRGDGGFDEKLLVDRCQKLPPGVARLIAARAERHWYCSRADQLSRAARMRAARSRSSGHVTLMLSGSPGTAVTADVRETLHCRSGVGSLDACCCGGTKCIEQRPRGEPLRGLDRDHGAPDRDEEVAFPGQQLRARSRRDRTPAASRFDNDPGDQALGHQWTSGVVEQHQADPTVSDPIRQRFQCGKLAAKAGVATGDELHRDSTRGLCCLRLFPGTGDHDHMVGLTIEGGDRPGEKRSPRQLEIHLVGLGRYPAPTPGGEDYGADVTQFEAPLPEPGGTIPLVSRW